MNTNERICPVCNGKTTKTGKLHGVAALQSMDSRSGLGGSEILVTFCAECGEVLGMKVATPEHIR